MSDRVTIAELQQAIRKDRVALRDCERRGDGRNAEALREEIARFQAAIAKRRRPKANPSKGVVIDTFAGLVPAKIISVAPDRKTAIVEFTATRGAYKRGDRERVARDRVVPKDAVHVRSGKYRIWAHASPLDGFDRVEEPDASHVHFGQVMIGPVARDAVRNPRRSNPLGSWYLANPRAPREAGVTVGGTFRRGWSRVAPGHYAHALGRVVKRGKHWYGFSNANEPAIAAAGGLAFVAVGGAMNAVERQWFRRGNPARRVAMARPGKPARYAETRPVMFDRIFLVHDLPEGGSESWLIAEGESIHDFLRKHPGYKYMSQAADELAEDDEWRLFRPFTYMVRNDAEAERRLAQERADREARRAARRAGR